MRDSAERTDASRGGAEPKVRFRGIVETDADDADFSLGLRLRGRQAERLGREIEQAARAVGVFIFFLIIVGWPIGSLLGHRAAVGSFAGWRLGESYGAWAIAFAVATPVVLVIMGHLAKRVLSAVGAVEEIAAMAQHYVQPDAAAVANVQTVGAVVRAQMEQLNAGIDDALIRLASAEAMIRQHVGAIEQAGAAVELRTSAAADRVAAERARLIDLTETLNASADEFAVAIAEKAQAGVDALKGASVATDEAEARFDERLTRLEAAAERALQSFDRLTRALADADERMRSSAGSIENSAGEAKRATELAARIADAAAESAARNAANVGMFAGQAAERAKKAADEAIDTARREAERAAGAAAEFAGKEAKRVADAAARAVEDVAAATRSAVESAAGEAEKAAAAASLVADAARRTTSAARDAAGEVKKASEAAQKSAAEALALSETAATRVDSRNKELAAARAALEAENARLESLIEEQRRRADRLAEAIASQTERLSRLAENQLREQEAAARLAEAQAAMREAREPQQPAKADAPQTEIRETAAAPAADVKPMEKERRARPSRKNGAEASNVLDLGATRPRAGAPAGSAATAQRLSALAAEIAAPKGARAAPQPEAERPQKDDVSWRDILSAADDAEPLDLGAAGRRARPSRAAADAMKIIADMQAFTVDLETRLFGEPPSALLERFARGDRNLFANRLLRLNESDVKRRIRGETARDKSFEKSIHQFLQGFERLLEDATTSDTADEELEEYLNSPLGRVYLLVGATVGYFA
jgi:hypothetical protein